MFINVLGQPGAAVVNTAPYKKKASDSSHVWKGFLWVLWFFWGGLIKITFIRHKILCLTQT